jgi:hypothetical protein
MAWSLRMGLQRLGPMEGKTEKDFQNALGKPQMISSIAQGQRFLQWRSGTFLRRSIGVVFDANHRFVKVASRYQV